MYTITDKDKRALEVLCALYGVKGIKFNLIEEKTNAAWDEKCYIYLRKEYDTETRFWSGVFHELAHSIAFHVGDCATLHQWYRNKRLRKAAKKAVKSRLSIELYFLEIEEFIDDMGKQLMQLHRPDLTFIRAYPTSVWERLVYIKLGAFPEIKFTEAAEVYVTSYAKDKEALMAIEARYAVSTGVVKL